MRPSALSCCRTGSEVELFHELMSQMLLLRQIPTLERRGREPWDLDALYSAVDAICRVGDEAGVPSTEGGGDAPVSMIFLLTDRKAIVQAQLATFLHACIAFLFHRLVVCYLDLEGGGVHFGGPGAKSICPNMAELCSVAP